ncbi:MAG TPA: hypothetical protein DEA73_03375 [Peptococcaceae bacterium]|nr:hypothetical protein [Peptococcaceae bacterium]
MTVSANRGRYTVEVTVFVEDYILRGEETAETAHSAVDLVLEKLERQVEKHKTKLIKKKRLKGSELKERIVNQQPEEEEAEEGEDQKVVKVKRFPVKPMSVEKAVLQMDLLGHDFFVFASTDGTATILRLQNLYRSPAQEQRRLCFRHHFELYSA